MTTKGKQTVFYIILFSALGVGGYFVYQSLSKKDNGGSLSDMALYIVQHTNEEYSFLITLDPAYISAWYNALNRNKNYFTLNNKYFDSSTGKEISKPTN